MRQKPIVEAAAALNNLYGGMARRPQRLWVDEGKEYYNAKVKAVAKKYGFGLYSAASDIKSAVAERIVRTFKTKLYRYLYEYKTSRYIDALPQLVADYNQSIHRTIGMAPADVRSRHISSLLQKVSPALINTKCVP